MTDIDKLTREDVVSMLESDKWQDNAIAVIAVIHHEYFDDEVIDLVKSFSGSDAPVPFDRSLGDLVEECLEKAS